MAKQIDKLSRLLVSSHICCNSHLLAPISKLKYIYYLLTWDREQVVTQMCPSRSWQIRHLIQPGTQVPLVHHT